MLHLEPGRLVSFSPIWMLISLIAEPGLNMAQWMVKKGCQLPFQGEVVCRVVLDNVARGIPEEQEETVLPVHGDNRLPSE